MITVSYVRLSAIDGQMESFSNEVNQFVFNDGSVQVTATSPIPPESVVEIVIITSPMSPQDQMALIMTVGALRDEYIGVPITLYMPFTPYGRQDAVFIPGQANAMKVWAGVINSMDFYKVIVVDPHSNAVAHIDRCKVLDIVDVLKGCPKFSETLFTKTLVSPDAGANKKCHKVAKEFGISDMLRADKARELSTGNIIETELFGNASDKDCVIIDDICDGGMTFIKLAEKLKAEGALRITLFVTHGIFSKGLSVFEGLIDEIHTTDTIPRLYTLPSDGYTGKVVVHNILK